MRADQILASWLRTRQAMGMGRAHLARHRSRQWGRLQPALAHTPALAGHAGMPHDRFPIVTPAEVRDDYGRWNSLGLTDEELRAMADAQECGEARGELSVGWSTGSGGGARGLFIANASERSDYIGQSLARLLPPSALLRRQRLALHLRANSALYSDVRSGRFAFAHFPLEPSLAETTAALQAFSPTIAIAPPHRLLALADARAAFPALRHLFYGSEPMSEAERSHVAERLGLVPQPIYQATEGFLGGACPHGRLHLNEYALEIELEPVPGTRGFRPIVSDLRRRCQPIVRVRGDDYVELEAEPCPCGFAGRAIAPLAGRVQDIWRYGSRAVTPPQVVATVEEMLGSAWSWRATASPGAVELRVAPACPADPATRAAQSLERQFALPVPVALRFDLPDWSGPKRRKVAWSDG